MQRVGSLRSIGSQFKKAGFGDVAKTAFGAAGGMEMKMKAVANSSQKALDNEAQANAQGINGTQSDGWVDAHRRTLRSGTVTFVQAYPIVRRALDLVARIGG